MAQSTFASEKVKNTSLSDHSWKLRCRKSAHGCGAKHMSKSKCTKQLLEVEMSKSALRCGAKHISNQNVQKKHQVRTTFGSCDAEKVHAVVVQSTFRSQNVQNTPAPDHFWKLRCRKSAHRCGAKHISKSKCTKHHMSAPLLEVQISKKCTPLWREANFEVKMYKTHQLRTTFGVSDVVSRGICTGL